MRKLLAGPILASICALALMACTTVTTGPPPSSTAVSSDAAVIVAKVEYGFEATYNVAGNLYMAHKDHLSPATKAQAKTILGDAYAAVRVARCLENSSGPACPALLAAAPGATIDGQTAIITTLAAKVAALIKGG